MTFSCANQQSLGQCASSGGIFSHSVYVYLDNIKIPALRPRHSMHTQYKYCNIYREKS
jgi:hypothetical protein